MARRYKPATNFSRSRPSSEKNPAEPLRRPRHETFAKAFALNHDAKTAAIEAGYPRRHASRAAGRLLSVKAMSARIQYIQTQNAEALTTKRLVQDLHLNPKAALAKAIARNPFTGETRLDLGRLTPSEIAGLEFSTLLNDGATRSGAGLRVQSSPGKALAALGKIMSDPIYASERREKASFAELLVELAQRGAQSALIRREMRIDRDDDK